MTSTFLNRRAPSILCPCLFAVRKDHAVRPMTMAEPMTMPLEMMTARIAPAYLDASNDLPLPS